MLRLRVKPQEPGAGYKFENKTVGGSVPKEYVGPTDAGIQGAMAIWYSSWIPSC